MSENPSILVAREITAALISSGVGHVAYCPGSRDAPFAYVLAAAERAGCLKVATFSEERGAGFWAVGAAKALRVAVGTGPRDGAQVENSACAAAGQAVAVITTSGTAVAELHPALEEAYYQSLPVIAVTADRPHEMRGVGSSQATHQEGIFASSVVAKEALPAIEQASEANLRNIRGRIGRIVASARGFMGQAGPVHVNVGFRDPLVPVDSTISRLTNYFAHRFGSATAASRVDPGGASAPEGGPSAEPATHAAPPKLTADIHIAQRRYPTWDSVVDPHLATVVVAGDSADISIAQMASARGIPILAEPSSGATACATWIPYQQVLAPIFIESVQQVIVTGRPTLSRPISALLARPQIRKIVVASHREWTDVSATAAVVVEGLAGTSQWAEAGFSPASPPVPASAPSPSIATPVTPRAENQAPASWLRQWREAAERIAQNRTSTGELSLPNVCQLIWQRSGQALLWLGASNTIRGFDLAATHPGRTGVYSNRGLAGIDGTIASALGLAMATGQPVRAVMGDMTFAYDLATLVQRPEGAAAAPNIQVIVLDDAGGSIFDSLEHGAAERDVYERFFAVAPHVDAVGAAQAAGWLARGVTSLAELDEELAAPITARSLLHLTIPWPTEALAAAKARRP